MQLVEGPVHPHRDFQMFQSSVLSDFIDHGRHAWAAQLSCAPWNSSTNLLSNEKKPYHHCNTEHRIKLFHPSELRLGFPQSSISTFSTFKPSVTWKLLHGDLKFWVTSVVMKEIWLDSGLLQWLNTTFMILIFIFEIFSSDLHPLACSYLFDNDAVVAGSH